MTFAQEERRQLADLFRKVGPDAPTLCEGWTTKDLAVHLVVRENRPDAAGGMFVSALEDRLRKVTADYEAKPFEELVDIWAEGAPKWNPMRWADQLVNASENFVHHEDVRRAREGWEPRELSPTGRRDLWRIASTMSRRMLRDSTSTVVLVRDDGAATTPVDREAQGAAVVTVTGDPGELVLWLFGRDEARVTVEGDESAVVRLSL
ncbi:TIGR03085 family metal-binding protein [uncultured Corynebacterium sp.]|uniref:TIGR03085 family metal-binding protein n=1 Tax=uncultured Corynebacterium sp. TaxID=159447 RepID=UPI0025F1EEB6|nr:TIGR03085 family metal-binding protein [uncultured Corynebacterium sp.]